MGSIGYLGVIFYELKRLLAPLGVCHKHIGSEAPDFDVTHLKPILIVAATIAIASTNTGRSIDSEF